MSKVLYYKETYGDRATYGDRETCIWKCEDNLWFYFASGKWTGPGEGGPSTYPDHINVIQMSKEEAFIEML